MVLSVLSTEVMQTAVEVAARRNNRVFFAYLAFLIVTALSSAFFAWLTWDSGNKAQSAIQSDANARIEAAKAIAAQANERSKTLEQGNLNLRSDLNSQTGQVAALQRDAANAKAEQQRVQTSLAEQQERTAVAEKSLIELREKMKGRTITPDQRQRFISAAKLHTGAHTRGPVVVNVVGSDPETIAYASEVSSLISSEGWSAEMESTGGMIGPGEIGLALYIYSSIPFAEGNGKIGLPATSPVGYGLTLATVLKEAGLEVIFMPQHTQATIPGQGQNKVELVVGHKPESR
jgi:hypothetical protein